MSSIHEIIDLTSVEIFYVLDIHVNIKLDCSMTNTCKLKTGRYSFESLLTVFELIEYLNIL